LWFLPETALDIFMGAGMAIIGGYIGVIAAARVLNTVLDDYPTQNIAISFIGVFIFNYVIHFIFFPQNTDLYTYVGVLQLFVATITTLYVFDLPPLPLLRSGFFSSEVLSALRSMDKLERSLPGSFGPQLGFAVIKVTLRQVIRRSADELRERSKVHPIDMIVMIIARNIAWDELGSGHHMMFGTRKMMTGGGLTSLYNHLTDLLEKAGIETEEEARQSRACLRDMIRERFGP
jgi:hypothetical protein